jgi:dTDP-4-amino-4,6-dideoxygalactose transaminase
VQGWLSIAEIKINTGPCRKDDRSKMINVTKSYLPPFEEYKIYLEKIWKNSWLTNQGPLATELEEKLKDALGVKNLLFVSNGTIALQLAIKALELKGEIITTPFSYVATTTSIMWENCVPVFADIDAKTFCIDPQEVEKLITPKTTAILATHVYGIPCAVEQLQAIARKYNLKIIYDGAHAFGVKYKGTSIFEYGDIVTLSFHATKLFHTIEGGAVTTPSDELVKKMMLYRSFGHIGDDHFSMGINAKNSEFHAAMGLCILPRINEFIRLRKMIAELYKSELKSLPLKFTEIPGEVEYNYAYFPTVFRSESELLKVRDHLALHNINTRRYFYPSLNKLPYLNSLNDCPVSEDISRRVLCLPFYQQLTHEEVVHISSVIRKCFQA